jgi:hypothetical protein
MISTDLPPGLANFLQIAAGVQYIGLFSPWPSTLGSGDTFRGYVPADGRWLDPEQVEVLTSFEDPRASKGLGLVRFAPAPIANVPAVNNNNQFDGAEIAQRLAAANGQWAGLLRDALPEVQLAAPPLAPIPGLPAQAPLLGAQQPAPSYAEIRSNFRAGDVLCWLLGRPH